MSPRDLDAWMERRREDAAAVDQCVRCGDPWDTVAADDATADALDCAAGCPVCRRCRAAAVAGEEPAPLPWHLCWEPGDEECPL